MKDQHGNPIPDAPLPRAERRPSKQEFTRGPRSMPLLILVALVIVGLYGWLG